MEQGFLFEIFRPEKKPDFLFKCSVSPGNFPLKRHEKPCSVYLSTAFFRKPFVNGNELRITFTVNNKREI